MSEKNEAFHRLAGKRVETITDAMRIFSNLSGPSYEFTPNEVLAYIRTIDEARNAVLERFRDTKRWRESSPGDVSEPSPIIHDDPVDVDGSQDEVTHVPAATASDRAEDKIMRRARAIAAVITESKDEKDTLAEMVAMQREVIERQQAELDELRRRP